MLFTTPGQVIVLAIVLLAGWMLGYASAPNAKKAQRKLRAQTDSFTAYHRDAEDKLRAANQRVADLKAENATLRADQAATEQTIASRTGVIAESEATERSAEAEPVVAEPVAQADAVPMAIEPVPAAVVAAEAPIEHATASGARDDLTRIQGIDGLLATRLFGLGVVRFEDIDKMSGEDELALEQRLALPVGTIARDQWRTQAALLRAQRDDGHRVLFGGEA